MADSGKVVPLCTEKEFGRLMEAAIESLAEWSELEVPSYVVRTKVIAAALIELDKSGRLLPSGGEVKEQWAVRWHLVGGGVDEQDCYRNARETAEQRARRLAARPPMGVERGEALMRRIYTGPWSPVLSDNSEKGAGDGSEA